MQYVEVNGCLWLISDIDCSENLQWSAHDIFRVVQNYGPIVLVALKNGKIGQLPVSPCTCCRYSH